MSESTIMFVYIYRYATVYAAAHARVAWIFGRSRSTCTASRPCERECAEPAGGWSWTLSNTAGTDAAWIRGCCQHDEALRVLRVHPEPYRVHRVLLRLLLGDLDDGDCQSPGRENALLSWSLSTEKKKLYWIFLYLLKRFSNFASFKNS